MTYTWAGLLLPESILVSPWFLLLATVVAFNTIIYVGLTLAKLIPWPQQYHPQWVREKAERIGFEPSEEKIMRNKPEPVLVAGDSPYEALREEVARRDIPQAFAFAGGLVVVFSALSALIFHDRELWVHVAELVLGVAYLVMAVVLSQRNVGGRTMMWAWVVFAIVMVQLLVTESLLQNSTFPLGYVLVVMAVFVPVTLAWRPALVAGALMLISIGVSLATLPGLEDLRILAAAASCFLIGAVLLRLRLRALDALADERARADALASTDPMTGTLTRRGLISLVPGIAATAERTDQNICVMYVDITHLQQANDDYGFTYGDDVVKVVADVLRGTVRKGDLVGRWDGDEFLVVGLGNQPDPESMRERLEAAIKMTGVALGRRPIEVTVGTSAGSPVQETFEDLVQSAKVDATGSAPAAN